MRFILLIMSCQLDEANGRNDACRDTFLQKWPLPYRFVIGGDYSCDYDDVLFLHVDDSYGGLTEKQRRAYAWACVHGYAYVFVSYVDTYIHVPRLLASNWHQHDYYGRMVEHGPHYISGGCGYWLSRRSLLNLPLRGGGYPDEQDGLDLARAGIDPVGDDAYGSTITRHLSRGTGNFDPTWMHEVHGEMS